MGDQIRIMQERRAKIISDIAESIKKSMLKNGTEYQFDFRSIVIATMAKFDCSKRLAQEYAEVALYKAGIDRSDLSDAPKDRKQKKLAL